MVFSSFEFLFRFLPVFLIIYYITPKKYRNFILFAGSIAFYTVGEAGYVLLLFGCVLVNYLLGRWMYRGAAEGRGTRQKILLLVALFYNFGILFFFKYSGWTDKLPLGISFYTFQIVAYIVDVYRGVVPAEKSFIRLGTYLTMFPQLVAGPIINYSDVRLQLNERVITPVQFEHGLKTLILGLGSKVILADRIGTLWNSVQAIGFSGISTPLAWLGAVAYSMELYFDFAGYSLMAMGLGEMLGFTIPVNFRYPYMSKSVSEFWRRWHITLGRWFRDYVYIPLGGNRKGRGRTILNLFVVWSLTALWHGAAPNFLIWGGMLLILLFFEKLLLFPFLDRHGWRNKPLCKALCHLYVLVVVPVTWVAFAVSDVTQLGIYLCKLFPFVGECGRVLNAGDYIGYLWDYKYLLVAGALCVTLVPKAFYKALDKQIAENVTAIVILGVSVYYLAVSQNNPFMYFNF